MLSLGIRFSNPFSSFSITDAGKTNKHCLLDDINLTPINMFKKSNSEFNLNMYNDISIYELTPIKNPMHAQMIVETIVVQL